MPSLTRAAIAAVAAAACLVALAWFDAGVLDDARQTASASFRSGSIMTLYAGGYILVAGAILLSGVVGSWSRSAVAGAAYALSGAFLVLMPALIVNPDLPEPLRRAIGDIAFATTGPIFAVEMLGGGLLLIGLFVIARSVVSRSRSTASTKPPQARGDSPLAQDDQGDANRDDD